MTDDRTDRAWQDSSRTADERAVALIAELTLEEKLAQLVGVWVGASDEGGEVAPFQHEVDDGVDLDAQLVHGLGPVSYTHLTLPTKA